MNMINIGILAHVDAGKTTLSESLLYLAGSIRKLGRVDHKNAFLDFDLQERERGITIFSKQAILSWKDIEITLIDSPGHMDFSAEMERILQVLDYAILVINGIDGLQQHSLTIWKLLQHYQIPTFIFVNKMDVDGTDKKKLLEDLNKELGGKCVDFTTEPSELYEAIALLSDEMLEEYLLHKVLAKEVIAKHIKQMEVYPCYFGSALKMQGISTFLDGLVVYSIPNTYPLDFGAKVFKISRDQNGNRLTHLKITGGTLKVKTKLENDEKVDQIRRYSGDKYKVFNEVVAGCICAVTGIRYLQAGEGIGIEKSAQQPVLESYLNYLVQLPEGCDQYDMARKLKQLSEEDPQLQVTYQEQTKELHLQLMGEIQIEVLKKMIKERYQVEVEFIQGSVNYKETITNIVEGVGHYEPLRHYAEVHVLLEPGDLGSGVQFSNKCGDEILQPHWQKLIMSHMYEKQHIGVLTGSPITDIKITLMSAKAHLKHTDGGDFREATYRAIRQGLKEAKSILLEPYYEYRMEIADCYMSRAIYDIEAMKGSFQITPSDIETVTITGIAPVSKMQNYQSVLRVYTKGQGKLSCTFSGYRPCDHDDDIILGKDYDSETDLENPTFSIFCSHGAGFPVKWNEVKNYMHLKSCLIKDNNTLESDDLRLSHKKKVDDIELERVFHRIYNSSKRKKYQKKVIVEQTFKKSVIEPLLPECLLVDGYNMIFSWPELNSLAAENMDSARERLIDLLSSYQGYKKCKIILVFDAYKVKNNPGTIHKCHNIFVVYTKQLQTADSYIEQAPHTMAADYRVIVATSDGLEQLIVIGQGAYRMSARQLKEELESIHVASKELIENNQKKFHNMALADLRLLNDKKSKI